jgi:glycosyltransferase involved in cell wall biosynthesis
LKRILFVDHDFGFSGATVSLEYLVSFFIKSGVQVFILTPKSDADQRRFITGGAHCISCLVANRQFLRLGLHFTDKIQSLSPKGIVFLLKEAGRVLLGTIISISAILKVRPDLVYVNEYVSLQASIAARLCRVRSVIHVRSPFLVGTFGIRRRLLSFVLLKCCDIIFAITEIESRQIERGRSNRTSIIVVPEFLGENNFQPRADIAALQSRFKLPQDKRIILLLGGIYKIKGTLDFLLSARKVLVKTSNAYFVIAGKEFTIDPEYYHECKRIAGLPEFDSNLAMLGEIQDQIDLIASCNVLVSSNTETHFSRPIIEAWAQKKPVVATDMAHNVALVDNEVNGLIVKTGNHQEMATAICNLIDDDSLAKRLGNNGYDKSRNQFESSSNVRRIFISCQELSHEAE